METQFVPYELAVKLKELGFKESTFAYYETNGEIFTGLGVYHSKYLVKGTKACLAPLWQQAFMFISSKIKFDINTHSSYALTFDTEFSLEIREFMDYEGYSINDVVTGNYETLKKLIELCK